MMMIELKNAFFAVAYWPIGRIWRLHGNHVLPVGASSMSFHCPGQ